jgi:hypothetical protein
MPRVVLRLLGVAHRSSRLSGTAACIAVHHDPQSSSRRRPTWAIRHSISSARTLFV